MYIYVYVCVHVHEYTCTYVQVTSTTRPSLSRAIHYLADDHSSDEESISAPPYSPFSLSSLDEIQYNSNQHMEDEERNDDFEEESDVDEMCETNSQVKYTVLQNTKADSFKELSCIFAGNPRRAISDTKQEHMVWI